MRKLVKLLGLVVCLFFMLAPLAIAQVDYCEGDFDYDRDQDGTDAFTFKADFGRSTLLDPCPADGPAPVPKTGQISCYDADGNPRDCVGTGEDGEYQKGVVLPNPRFTDQADGTVTDNLTGLIWLKNTNCFDARTWNDALSDCKGLSSGSCGLTDGSNTGDWRLPNRSELYSLVDTRFYQPALSNTAGTGQWVEGDPFTSVQPGYYWSSTTTAGNSAVAWGVYMDSGDVRRNNKSSLVQYVWPVRGGH